MDPYSGQSKIIRYGLIESALQDITEKSSIVLAKVKPEGKYTFYAAIDGINNLHKYPSTQPLKEYLIGTDDKVAIIYPRKFFPANDYPDAVSSSIVVPEHNSTINKIFYEDYIIAFIPTDEFRDLDIVSRTGFNFINSNSGVTLKKNNNSPTLKDNTSIKFKI